MPSTTAHFLVLYHCSSTYLLIFFPLPQFITLYHKSSTTSPPILVYLPSTAAHLPALYLYFYSSCALTLRTTALLYTLYLRSFTCHQPLLVFLNVLMLISIINSSSIPAHQAVSSLPPVPRFTYLSIRMYRRTPGGSSIKAMKK